MNNNENDFTNIQPQDSNIGGQVPPLDQNMGVPSMSDSVVNSVPEMNQNMGAPTMSDPAVNPVPEMNQNMGVPSMNDPVVNPVPEMNQNMGAPTMSDPVVNSVPEINSNMEVAGMSNQTFNQVPNMNANMGTVPPLNTNINTTNKGFMSKYGKYIFVGLFVVVIAAIAYLLFGGKKLECSMEDDYAGMKMTQSVQVKFSGSKANYVQMIMSIDLSEAGDELKDYTSVLVETLKSQTEQYKNKGMNVDIKENASSIVVTVTAKRDTMSLLDMSEDEATFDKIKKSLEKEGYTCK